MKVLTGALAGLVLGAAIVAGLTVAGVAKNYWPILVVAVVAGMAMSLIASSSRAKYLKGGLAALATAVAMIVGQMAAAQVLSKQATEIGPATQSSKASVEELEAVEGADGEVAEIEETAKVILPVSPRSIGGPAGAPRAGDISTTDIAFFAVGCLIAYQLGKGKDAAEHAANDAAETPASDPGDSEAAPEEQRDA